MQSPREWEPSDVSGATTIKRTVERLFRPPANHSGVLVSIVGFDGSGKTTQIMRVSEALRSRGHEVVETRQPTDWYRELAGVRLFHDKGGSVASAYILALLSAADRRRHVMEVIDPALARGAVVICDRYVYATFGVFLHRGVDRDFLATINSGIPRPDYAFYLQVPTDELVRRLRTRDGDGLKYEEKSVEQIESIIGTYEQLGSALISIDGSTTREEITASILTHMKDSLPH